MQMLSHRGTIVLRTLLAAVAAMMLLLTACDEFIGRSDADLLREMEKNTYVLRKDVDIEGKKLSRGERVKIVITGVREWIKVHAYPARADALKAERYLILYLFPDDFPDGSFSMKYFEEQLDAVAAAVGGEGPAKRAGK